MRRILTIIALSAIALPGCATPVATAIIVGAMAADAVDYYGGRDGSGRMYPAPAPDPSRAINIQDCTQPIDYVAGNLMCR